MLVSYILCATWRHPICCLCLHNRTTMHMVQVGDPGSRIVWGSLDLCMLPGDTILLAGIEAKRVYQGDLIYKTDDCISRHTMPATCRQIEFTPVL